LNIFYSNHFIECRKFRRHGDDINTQDDNTGFDGNYN
jgi:hypothetical protein